MYDRYDEVCQITGYTSATVKNVHHHDTQHAVSANESDLERLSSK